MKRAETMTLAERLARGAIVGYDLMSHKRDAVLEMLETVALRALDEAAAVLDAQADLVEREYRLVYGTGTCAQAVGLRDGAKLVRAMAEEGREA